MKLKIIFKLAYRNLLLHRLRAMLTVVGVTIGIGAIVFLVSLGYGLERLVTSQVANFNAFTVVDVPAANLKTLKLDDATIDKIKKLGHVEKITPVINLAGRVKKEDGASAAETVIVGAESDYWKLAEIYTEKGQLPQKNDEAAINQAAISLIGETNETALGQKLSLDVIIPKELRKPDEDLKIAEGVKVKISGILKDNKAPLVLVPQAVLTEAGTAKYSSLKLKVDKRDNVAALRQQLENIGFSSEYVGDTVNEIAQVFSLFRAILAAFGLIALIVAALGAFNTLTISLLERIREVGLFKALGMRNRDIYKIFMAESLIIGISGGVLGLVVGEIFGYGTNIVLSYLAQRAGTEAVSVFSTPLIFALSVALFSIIVGFVTGLYPAKRAVKLNPLDALRFE